MEENQVLEQEAQQVVAEAPKAEVKPVSNASADNASFDWDAFESDNAGDVDVKATTEAYEQSLSKIAEGEVVEGVVVAKNKREVVVNIGYKSEAVINAAEFKYCEEDLKIGDTVEVLVESTEDKKGQLLLSHKRARALRSWDRVNEAFEKDEIVKGFVKCRTKGGMIVDVFGIEAFLPGSQIDVKPIRDYDVYVNKTMDLKIVKINNEFRNVVVSHKALEEAIMEEQKAALIGKLEKGQVVEGVVKNITSYGVFVDLGGVDGLVHITDLSWGRINHPEEVVALDQKIQVVILDFDDVKKRIALGIKQLTPHPWDALDANLKVGDTVKGKVVVIADYGAFVEVQPGVEGLIHVSEMSWSLHLRSAQDFFKVGDEVEAVILTLDREERKMSLGIKQLKPDPWASITELYPIGSKHTATVRNITNFGVFVELKEGVEGLVHISDLSWTKKIKHPSEIVNVGDTIEVVVLDIEQSIRHLSLGHKQLEPCPWEEYESLYTTGAVVDATVATVTEKGATVTFENGIEGIVTAKGMTKQDGTTIKEGETLPFKVLEFNKNSRKLVLSHTRTFEEPKKEAEPKVMSEEAAAEKAIKRNNQANTSATFGDIDALAALKSQMEAEK